MIRPRELTVWTRRTNGLETKLLRSCVTRVQSARLHFSFIFPAIQARRLVVHKAF